VIVVIAMPQDSGEHYKAGDPMARIEIDLVALNQAPPQPPSLESLEETRKRPIFIATRRPAAMNPNASGDSERLILGRYRLMGVVITPSRRTVVIKPARGGKTTELRVGSTIEGWTVDEIAPKFMKLKAGAAEEIISLMPGQRNKSR
tara:strand:+ start:1460 stop:1900 length:441 start_codon:yes stop_codon:yes gene_type:complete